MAKGVGALLGGVAAGGMVAMKAKDRKDARSRRDAARAAGPSGPVEELTMSSAEQAEVSEAMGPEELGGEGKRYADGGEIRARGEYYRSLAEKEDKSKRRKTIDKGEDEALGMAGGGVVVGKKRPYTATAVKAYANGGVVGEARDQGKTSPPPANPQEFRTEVTAFLAGGGMVNGEPLLYSTGGLLLGNTIPGGYTQHGSYTTTSDPLWHMECHRDFGKKQP